MTQIPIIKGDDEKMRTKHCSIALVLIQLFVITAMIGAMSPTVSAYSPADEGNISSDWLDRPDDIEPKFVRGEILVKFRTSITTGLSKGVVTTGITSVNKLNKRFEVRGMKKIFSNVYKLELPKYANVLSVARAYETDPNVEYAEPNRLMHTFLVPNDEYYSEQWAHQMIESEYAWNTTTGNQSVLVAIVDTGIDYNHEDLNANYVALGYDWVNNDTDPIDDNGHGTHCAGIVAAKMNNEIGVTGLAQVRIMAEKVINLFGYATDEAIANGILHATDQGADIISMSFGGYYRSETVHNAIKYAYDSDVLLVAAAGNDRFPLKGYPAGYEEVIAVAATDQNDDPALWSLRLNKGSAYGEWIELAAPGDYIYSTLPGNSYNYQDGTSMAGPHVSGVAALIWSQFPDATRDQVRYQLRRTAVDRGDPGFDIYYGYGRINASGAVNQDIPEHDLLVLDWKLPFASESGDNVMVNTTVLNFGNSVENNIKVKLLVNGTKVDSKVISLLNPGESTTVSCSWIPVSNGKYNITTYVSPKEESNEENNGQSAYTWVRNGKAVTVHEQGDFATIGEAVNTTNLVIYYGDATIWVASGIYYEYDLLIQNLQMSLTLTGEDRSTTIIDSEMQGYATVWVHADNVAIRELTIQNIFDTGIELIDANNSTISNNAIIEGPGFLNADFGIYIHDYCNDVTITNNTISTYEPMWGSFINGIFISDCSGNLIHNNTILYAEKGILMGIQDSTISSNTISNSRQFGIQMASAHNNIISFNIISNGNSIYHLSGLMLGSSNDNLIKGNTLTDNKCFYACIFQSHSDNNTIVENNIQNTDGTGLWLQSSDDNVIHHNNFVNNDVHVNIDEFSLNNMWNFTTWVGNYWSGYTDVDEYSGPYQNETGSDGIWDNPKPLPEGQQDDYPLVWKWFPGDLDGDGDVDWFDYGNFSAAYGSQMGDPNYNPLADLDYDGDVDRYDYGIFAANYGKSIPY